MLDVHVISINMTSFKKNYYFKLFFNLTHGSCFVKVKKKKKKKINSSDENSNNDDILTNRSNFQ